MWNCEQVSGKLGGYVVSGSSGQPTFFSPQEFEQKVEMSAVQ